MSRGLTLIEVLVSVTLLAITASAVTPWLREVRRVDGGDVLGDTLQYEALVAVADRAIADPTAFGLDPDVFLISNAHGTLDVVEYTELADVTYSVLQPTNPESERLWIVFSTDDHTLLRWIKRPPDLEAETTP